MTGCSLKNQLRVKSSHTTTLYHTHDVHTTGASSSCFSQPFARDGWHHKANQEGSAKHTPSIIPLPTLWIPSLTAHCALKEQPSVQTTSQGIHFDDSTNPRGIPLGKASATASQSLVVRLALPTAGPFTTTPEGIGSDHGVNTAIFKDPLGNRCNNAWGLPMLPCIPRHKGRQCVITASRGG
jgi:hypothetical protein